MGERRLLHLLAPIVPPPPAHALLPASESRIHFPSFFAARFTGVGGKYARTGGGGYLCGGDADFTTILGPSKDSIIAIIHEI